MWLSLNLLDILPLKSLLGDQSGSGVVPGLLPLLTAANEQLIYLTEKKQLKGWIYCLKLQKLMVTV